MKELFSMLLMGVGIVIAVITLNLPLPDNGPKTMLLLLSVIMFGVGTTMLLATSGTRG